MEENQMFQNTKDIANMQADHKILSDQVNKMAQALESGFGNVSLRIAKLEKHIPRLLWVIGIIYMIQVLPPDKLGIVLEKAPAIISSLITNAPIGG